MSKTTRLLATACWISWAAFLVGAGFWFAGQTVAPRVGVSVSGTQWDAMAGEVRRITHRQTQENQELLELLDQAEQRITELEAVVE